MWCLDAACTWAQLFSYSVGVLCFIEQLLCAELWLNIFVFLFLIDDSGSFFVLYCCCVCALGLGFAFIDMNLIMKKIQLICIIGLIKHAYWSVSVGCFDFSAKGISFQLIEPLHGTSHQKLIFSDVNNTSCLQTMTFLGLCYHWSSLKIFRHPISKWKDVRDICNCKGSIPYPWWEDVSILRKVLKTVYHSYAYARNLNF